MVQVRALGLAFSAGLLLGCGPEIEECGHLLRLDIDFTDGLPAAGAALDAEDDWETHHKECQPGADDCDNPWQVGFVYDVEKGFDEPTSSLELSISDLDSGGEIWSGSVVPAYEERPVSEHSPNSSPICQIAEEVVQVPSS